MALLDFLKKFFAKKEPAPSSPSESQGASDGSSGQAQGTVGQQPMGTGSGDTPGSAQ